MLDIEIDSFKALFSAILVSQISIGILKLVLSFILSKIDIFMNEFVKNQASTFARSASLWLSLREKLKLSSIDYGYARRKSIDDALEKKMIEVNDIISKSIESIEIVIYEFERRDPRGIQAADDIDFGVVDEYNSKISSLIVELKNPITRVDDSVRKATDKIYQIVKGMRKIDYRENVQGEGIDLIVERVNYTAKENAAKLHNSQEILLKEIVSLLKKFRHLNDEQGSAPGSS